MFSLLLPFVLSATIPSVSLNELELRYKNGGDTVFIVNFWATWCKPCIAELPAFDKISREFRDRPVKIILVNVEGEDSRETRIEPFVKKQGLDPEVVILLDDKPHIWIDRVDTSWSGAIPATLFLRTSTQQRSFQEKELNYQSIKDVVLHMLESPK